MRRHGKHLWLELDRRPWPCLHFGMTGGIHLPAGRAVRLVSDGSVDRPDWPPRFTKLHLRFAGGGELALADGRRLGRIRLRQDPSTEPPISTLGFDAWRALPTSARFHAMLRERKSPIKAVLLDQSFAAGIGNWIADEVLYQAGIAPKRRASTLSAAGGRAVAREDPVGDRPRGAVRLGQRPVSPLVALPPPLGPPPRRATRHHRAGRAHPPRDGRRPHHRLGAHGAALRYTPPSFPP